MIGRAWAWVLSLAIVLGALSLAGCGTYGGICDPNVNYPKGDPCYRDPQKQHNTGNGEDDERFK